MKPMQQTLIATILFSYAILGHCLLVSLVKSWTIKSTIHRPSIISITCCQHEWQRKHQQIKLKCTQQPKQSDVIKWAVVHHDEQTSSTMDRRHCLDHIVASATTFSPIVLFGANSPVQASDNNKDLLEYDDVIFERRDKDYFAYQFQPPSNFEMYNKPLKTHLDEVNFRHFNVRGYEFGITVDPVRIDSLTDFGTPEQVAAKVILVEVNRDGITNVMLMQDPESGVDASNNIFYQLNYMSTGKRGKKRFVTKFSIANQKLYALTAQCKEEQYMELEEEILASIRSFTLVAT